MKTRSNIFYNFGDNPGFNVDVDEWVQETPGEIVDVKIAQNGKYGLFIIVLYKEHDTTDWGPN